MYNIALHVIQILLNMLCVCAPLLQEKNIYYDKSHN